MIWRRIMSWLRPARATDQASRLDAALASNLAAQGDLRQESAETAEAAMLARRKAVVARRMTRRVSRRFDHQRMNTGDVRALVDGMLATLDPAHRNAEDDRR